MDKESLYLDTSVISAHFDSRAEERQSATRTFWRITVPQYHCRISEITKSELDATKNDALRKKFMRLIKDLPLLTLNDEIRDLARAYLDAGVFPLRYADDALHVAIASYHKIDYLISWNFEHLVKVKTRRLVNSVNLQQGLSQIEIVSPLEL